MTLEEQERRAYADGHTEIAATLGLAIDAESEKVLEAEHEVRGLKDEIRSLEERIAELEDGA